MNLASKQLFTNKKLISMTLPLILESYLGILLGMVDSVMVSSVGEAAISGVSLVGNMSAVLLMIFSALTGGGSIVISQYLGAPDREGARRAAGQMVMMSMAASVAMMVLFLLAAKQMLRLCFGNVEQDVMEAAEIYFYYLALSFPFIALGSAASVICRCSGNTKLPMLISVGSNVVNVVGNAICIFGLKMGVAGVALPTLISRALSGVLIMAAAVCSKEIVNPHWKDITKFHWPTMARILKLGVPPALESSSFQVGGLLTLSMISEFGTYQLAANSTAHTLVNIANVPTFSLYNIALLAVAQCVGAHDLQQIKSNTKKLVGASYVIGSALAVLILCIRYPLLGIYQSLSAETVELAAQLMVIHLVGTILFFPPSFCMNATLQAANDMLFVTTSGIGSVVLRVIVAQLLCMELGWGAQGVWIAIVTDWACRSVMFALRLRSGAWKKKCGLA